MQLTSNHELIRKGLDLLREGLKPFVEKEMRKVYGNAWEEEGRTALRRPCDAKLNWDAYALLTVIDRKWNEVFCRTFDKKKHRSWVFEARDLRATILHIRPLSLMTKLCAVWIPSNACLPLLTRLKAEECHYSKEPLAMAANPVGGGRAHKTISVPFGQDGFKSNFARKRVQRCRRKPRSRQTTHETDRAPQLKAGVRQPVRRRSHY